MVKRRKGKNRRVKTQVKGQSTLDNFSGQVTITNHTVKKRKAITHEEKDKLKKILIQDEDYREYNYKLWKNNIKSKFFEEFAQDTQQSVKELAERLLQEEANARLQILKEKYNDDYLQMPLEKSKMREILNRFGPTTYGEMAIYNYDMANIMLKNIDNNLDMLLLDFQNRYRDQYSSPIDKVEEYLNRLDEYLNVLKSMQDDSLWIRQIDDEIIDLSSYRSDYYEVLINDTRSHTQWGEQERALITNQVLTYGDNIDFDNVFKWDTAGIGDLKEEWYEYYRDLSKYVLDMTYVLGDYYTQYLSDDEEAVEKFLWENRGQPDIDAWAKSIEEYNARLNEMIRMLPGVENDTIIYRGGRFDENAKVGDIGEFAYITSVSFDRHVALEFAHENGRHEYLITIYAPKGSHMASVDKNAVPDSRLTDLHEAILGQGQKYKVIGVNHDAKTVEIMLIN